MSKYDWKKELKDNVIDASLLTTGIYSLSFLGSKMGISKPTLALNAENIVKFFGYLILSDLAKDYAKQQKWIPTS